MPTVAVKGAIIVVSVAVAAAIAVYESPQARQFAEDVRRKIAIALHALGDEIGANSNDSNAQPRFNRPEDAEGFLLTQGESTEQGVDADEDTKRRQREELMYWNAIRLSKLEQQAKENGEERPQRSRGSSFEDFLKEEEGAERGSTYVLHNTGADVRQEEGLRQRSAAKGLERGSAWANPFGDEHGIESSQESGIAPNEADEKYEVLSQGLYSAHDSPRPEPRATIDQLIDTSDPPISLPDTDDQSAWNQERIRNIPISSPSPEAEAAFASIHAWADQTNASFYSPLPTTPRALSPVPSQPLHLSTPVFTGEEEFDDPPESVPGDFTPTDSMSIVDGTDLGEVWGTRSGATSEAGLERRMDVLSVADSDFEDGDGIHTPSSWSEVASVVSESDAIAH